MRIGWRCKTCGGKLLKVLASTPAYDSDGRMQYIVTHALNQGQARTLIQNAASGEDALAQAQAGKGITIPGQASDIWNATLASTAQTQEFLAFEKANTPAPAPAAT